MKKPVINHDTEKLQDVFPEEELNEEKLEAYWTQALEEPAKFFGEKKSQTVEMLYDAVLEGDREKIVVLSMLLVKGATAMMILAQISERTKKELSRMDPESIPAEIREAMKQAGMEVKEHEPEDEFEALKRKYGV